MQYSGLIINSQINEDNNNGKGYSVLLENNERDKITNIYKTWKTKTYKYYLNPIIETIYDNFYTEEVIKKIENQEKHLI
jgi:hypothetical protein